MQKREFQILLGKKIAEMREKKGLTQLKLGDMLDKEKQSITRIEKGRTNISTYLLYQISVELDIPIAKLLDFMK